MQNESVKYNVRRPDLEKVIGYKKETSPLKNNIVDDRSRLPNMNKSPLLCTSVKVTKKSKKKNIDGKTFSRKNSNRKIKLHNAEETCIILRKKFDFMNTKLFSKKSEVYSSEKCMKDSDISQKKKDVTFKNGINNITQNLTGTWLDANITEIVEAIVDESNVCTSLIGHCSQALEVGKNLEKSISTLNKNFPRYETEVLGSTETDPLNTQKKETPLVSKTTMTVESDGVKKTAHQALLSSLNDNCQFKEITDIRERKTRFPEKSESDFKVVETGQSKIKEFNEKQIRLITEDKIVTRLRDPTPDINIDISPGKSDSFLGDTFLTIDMVEDHDCYDRNCSSGRLADLECPSGVALNCYSELTLPEHVSSSQSLITAQKESIIKYSENIPKRSTVENPHYNSELSRNVKMKKTTVNVGTPEGFPMGSSSVRKNLQTISQSSIFSSKDIAQSLRTYSKNYQIKIKEKEKMGCMDDNPVVSSIGRGNHLNPVRKGQLNTEDSNMIEVTEDYPNDSTSVTNAGLVSNKFVLSQPKRFSEKNKSLQNLNTVTKIPDYKIPNNNRMLHNKKLIKCNIALSEKKIADCEEKPVKPETSKNEELITTTDVELENQKYSVSAKAVALSCSNPQVDFFLSCDSENKEDEGCLYLDSSKSQQHQQYSPKSVSERRQTAVNYTLLPFSSVTKEQRNTTNLDICQITLVSENLLKAAINSESVENLQKHSHYDNQGTCVNDKWNLSSITHEGLCSEVHCIHMTTNKDNLIKTFEENLSSIENNMQNRFQNGTEVSSNVEQEPNDLNSESEFLVNMSCKSAHKLFFTDDENENCDNDDSQQTANSLRKSSPTVTQNKFKQQASSNLEYSEKISKKKDLYKTPESVQELHTTNAMPEPELKNIYENQYGVGTPVNFGMFKSVNLSPVVKIKRLPFSVIKSIVVKSADSTQKKTSLSISSSSPTSGSLKSVDSETESCCFSKKESKRDSHFSESCKSTDDKANVPGSYLSEISQTRRTCDHLLSSSVFKERQSNFSVLKQKLSFAEGMISEDVKKCTSYSKKSELDIPNVKSLDMYNIQATIRSSGNNHSTEVSPPRPPLNNVGSFYLDELDTEILDYEPEPQDVSLEVASIRTLEFEEDLMISGLGSHRNEKRENFKIDDLTNSEASEVECLETDKSTTKDIERYMKTNLDTGTEAQASSESIAVADEENTDSESGIFQWIKKNQQRNNHKTILNTRHPNEFAQKVDTQMLLTENHSMNLPTDDVGVDEEDTLSLCPCSPSILMEDLSNNEEEPHDSGVAEKSRLKFPSDEPLSSNKFPCADPRLTSSERLKMKIQQSERIANQESNSSKGIIKKIGNKNILTDFGKKNLKVTESQDKSQGCKIISSEKGRGRNNSIRSIAFTPKGYCRSFWLHGQCNRNWCKFVHMLGSGKVNSECFGENVKGSLLSQDLAHESEAIILQHIKKSCEQGTLNKAFQDFQKVYLRQQVHFIKQLLRILASSSVKLKQSGRVKFVVQYIRKLFLVDGSFCSEIISLCEECMEHTRDALWDIFQLCSENKISLHPKAIQILMHAFMTHMRDWSKIFPVMMYGVSYCHIQIPSDILDLGLQELHHNPYLCNLPLILVDKLPPSDFTHLSSDGIRNFISVLNKVGRYADAKKIHYKLEMLSNQQRSKFLSSQNNSFETNLLTRIHKFVDEDSWGQVQTIFSEDGLERKDGNVIFTIYNAISQHTDKAGEKFSCFVRTVTLNGSHLPDKPHQYLLAQMGCALLLESHQNNHLNVTFEVLETMLDYKIDFYQLLQHDTVPIANTIGIPPLVIKSPSHVALVAVEICLTLEKLREAQKILTMTDWVITTNQNLELQAQEQLWRAQLLKKLSTQLLKIEQLRNGALVLKKLLETLKNDLSDPKTQQNMTEEISELYNQYIVKLLNWRDLNEAMALYEYFRHLGAWLDLDRPILRALVVTCMQLERTKEAHELFKHCCLMGVYTMQKPKPFSFPHRIKIQSCLMEEEIHLILKGYIEQIYNLIRVSQIPGQKSPEFEKSFSLHIYLEEVQTENTHGILLLESTSTALFSIRERISSVLSCRLTPPLELSSLGTQNMLIVNPYCLYQLLEAWESLNLSALPLSTFQTTKLHASLGQLQVVMQESPKACNFRKPLNKDIYPSSEELEVYARDVENEESTRKTRTSRSKKLGFMGHSSSSPFKLNFCKKSDFLIPAPGEWRSNSTDFTSSGRVEVNVPCYSGNRAMLPTFPPQLGKRTLNNTVKKKNYRNNRNKKRRIRAQCHVANVDSVLCTNKTVVGVESSANYCSGKPTRIKKISNNLSVAPNCSKTEKSGLMTTQIKKNKLALESLKVHLTPSHLGASRMVTSLKQCDFLPYGHPAVKGPSSSEDVRNVDMSSKKHLPHYEKFILEPVSQMKDLSAADIGRQKKCQTVSRASRVSFLTRKHNYVTKGDVSEEAISMNHPSTGTARQSIGMKTILSPSNLMCTLSNANERIVFDKTFNYLKTQLLCRSATKQPEAELDAHAKTLSYQFITMEKKRGPVMVQKSLFKRLTDFGNANISFE